jgi:multidrug efflux pump subunit AcrB
MWIVRLALRRPYTFVVMAMLIAVLGGLAFVTMSTDIFPDINIPVVSVIWSYTGLSPSDMEKRVVFISERAMTTTVSGIEHMESQSMNGVGVIKIYFQPNVHIEEAVAEVTAIQQTILRVLPPNITPPLIIRYSASSVPVLQIAASSKTLSEQELYDFDLNFLRQQLATVQGASVPLPYGGKPRQIMVDINSAALYAKGLSATDVTNALNLQNLILPAGSVKIDQREYLVKLNSSPDVVAAFNDLPIKQVNGSTIYMRDIAQIHDGFAVQQNIVRFNGQAATLLSVLKSGGASTLDIVRRIKARLEEIRPGFPAGFDAEQLFDQSIFVTAAVSGVIKEALIAACLTATMILVFLGSWRSTLIIAVSIPLSILTSLLLLDALGYTLNVMTLGGLSLAVGILVDDATVELENIHRNLGIDNKSLTRAVLDGAQQIAVPAFVATLSICIVFVSVVFLNGPAKYLFVPLALAVVFAMMTSYLLSRTLVPVMVHFLLGSEVALYREEAALEQRGGAPPDVKNVRHKNGPPRPAGDGQEPPKNWVWRVHERFNHHFENFRERYRDMLAWALDNRGLTIIFFLILFAISACLIPFVGEDFFPAVDAGQFRLHVRTAAGTRIEQADVVFNRVEQYIRSVVPKDQLRLMIDNIGLPVGGVNLAFSDSATIGSTDGEILASLAPGHKTSVWEFVRRLRRELPVKFPGVIFYFQPADIVSQILNFGLPAPIDIQVVGRDKGNYQVAQQIQAQVAKIPGAVDVTLHQLIDAPQFDVNVDRERASNLGLSENDVANSLLISLSSSGQTARNYWVNPVNGVNYLVAVQTPQYQVDSLNALNNTPIIVPGQTQAQLLSNLATTTRDIAPVVINHYNVQPTFDIYADAQDRDLGGVAGDIDQVIQQFVPKLKWYQAAIKSLPFCHNLFKLPPPRVPKATLIAVRGQVESMNTAFTRLGIGIVFAVMLVYFLMVVNFQSWLDPLIIIMALPGAFAGILWMLFATHTTFSVPSLMGTIMCIGVATSNSILLITFANDQRLAQMNAYDAALDAGATRLRPVLMTALAMILGMIPMSLGLGEGGEQNAPLGRAVIGGLLFATATTLFFVPVIYSMLRKKDLVSVSEEDAELLFDEDEPERQLARAHHQQDSPPGDGAAGPVNQ